VEKHLSIINWRVSTAQSEVADLTYGGTASNDNSGSIRYLRVEFAGAAFNSEKNLMVFHYLVLVQEQLLNMLKHIKVQMTVLNSLVVQ
jgi:hypothetical protein